MPEGARLLLAGDAAQLPPIGFGLVYHALVSDPHITANLTVIHRQSPESGIPAVSAAIRLRRMPTFSEYRGVADGVSFVRCESGLIGDAVESIVLQLGGYSNGVLVVSPTKKGPGGVDALNARLHEQFRPQGAAAHDVKGFNAQHYTIGDPVMWLRNDYSRGLFNGLIGQVKSIPEPRGAVAGSSLRRRIIASHTSTGRSHGSHVGSCDHLPQAAGQPGRTRSGADLRVPGAGPLVGLHGHYASRTSGHSGGRPGRAALGSQKTLDFRKSAGWIRMASLYGQRWKTLSQMLLMRLSFVPLSPS
jgi:hypothetical protein